MTKVIKSNYGWKAETSVELDDKYSLLITTSKRLNRKLATIAIRAEVSEHFITTVFGDFYEKVIEEDVRVTEKSVTDQHNRALEHLDAIKARCAAFYAAKETV